jgi:hypothetical protein
MAQIILTQLREAVRAVMATGSEAFGDGMEETGDASRQLALMQSLAMMVGKMAQGIQQEDALAHWSRQLLQMLEDNAHAAAADVPAMLRFYKAVGQMQALLGVPEDRRAWSPELQEKADKDFPLDENGASSSGLNSGMTDTLPTMDVPRHDIASRATYEVQILALTLRDVIEETDTSAEIEAAARGILTRISDLSDILFEAVINDDEGREDIPTLRRKMGMK